MSFVAHWKGKNVRVSFTNPEGLGVCDDSGFDFNHCDLVKQMEWRGDNLVWTGLMVGKPYLDKPCQQNRPPLVKDDPKPFKNIRLPKEYTAPEENRVAAPKELFDKLNSVHWNE